MRLISARQKLLIIAAAVALTPVFALAAPVGGSQAYTSPGTYTFTVPSYGTLTVQMWGGGGGGGSGYSAFPATGGGYSAFNGSVVAYGGSPGGNETQSYGGAGGSAGGGDTNLTGGTGGAGSGSGGPVCGGYGGAAPYGGAGGPEIPTSPCTSAAPVAAPAGGAPGGGGSGADSVVGCFHGCPTAGGGGGGAGYASKTYATGALTPGATVTVVVGAGAVPNQTLLASYGSAVAGGAGGNGEVYISWTAPAAPTVSLSASPTSIVAGTSTALTWSSTNATSCTGTGFSTGGATNGSTNASPTTTTTYSVSCTGAGGTASASQTVNVTPAPTCSVTITPNPSAYAYTGTPVTVTWSSANATQVYINTIKWVNPSGSIQVASQANTDYSCYGYSASYGDGPTTPASLTVTPPPNPTASIAASSTAIYTNQPTNITADFSAGSGDILTGDNIDSPMGTGLGATTNPDASKTISFSSATPGTYTFYAMAQTQYYTSWASYKTLTVTVSAAPPTDSLSASKTTIARGSSSTLSWSSTNATGCTINNGIGSVGASGSKSVSPNTTTTYSGSCTGPGGTVNFNNVTVTVTCTPTTQYICGGSGNETIIASSTSASCQTTQTNGATCSAQGSFCQAGNSSCQYLAPTFNPSGNQTGHLQITPTIVQSGHTTQVNWSVSNVPSCTVTGTNGDSWPYLSGPQTSKPITSQVTYTLYCPAYGSNAPVNESESVNIVPTYQEK